MDTYQQVGAQLRAFLQGFMGGSVAGQSGVSGAVAPSDELQARSRRQNASLIPASRHYATVLAYGNFVLADGTDLRCEAIQGISGVISLPTVTTLATGSPQVKLQRFLTHFYFEDPEVVIEQSPHKESFGYLTGASKGDARALLPGRATFSQFLILTLKGRPLANREPLVMTAQRVDEWPPIGSAFISEGPTDFYELEKLHDPGAKVVATLMKCDTRTVTELHVPER